MRPLTPRQSQKLLQMLRNERDNYRGSCTPMNLDLLRQLEKRGLVIDFHETYKRYEWNKLKAVLHLASLSEEGRRLAISLASPDLRIASDETAVGKSTDSDVGRLVKFHRGQLAGRTFKISGLLYPPEGLLMTLSDLYDDKIVCSVNGDELKDLHFIAPQL